MQHHSIVIKRPGDNCTLDETSENDRCASTPLYMETATCSGPKRFLEPHTGQRNLT